MWSKIFHNSSVRDKIGDMIFVFKPKLFFTTSIKLNDPTSLQESIAYLEKTWSIVYPSMVFDFKFFDENIDNFYREEKKLSTLLQIFSGVFLLLACLGLYGLMSFVINRRMKEVAVRKVFGAGGDEYSSTDLERLRCFDPDLVLDCRTVELLLHEPMARRIFFPHSDHVVDTRNTGRYCVGDCNDDA
ncbi:MAG: hypothetical protein WDO15_04115 [Bacteroidota bacterium]